MVLPKLNRKDATLIPIINTQEGGIRKVKHQKKKPDRQTMKAR